MPFWAAFLCGIVFARVAGNGAVDVRGASCAATILRSPRSALRSSCTKMLVNWISLTQGPLGIYGIKPPPAIALPGLPAISFGNSANMFYLVAGFALLFYMLLDQLVRSPIGETLTAIREDEVSAASLGINCTAWKVFAFGIGSAVAGAAGAFYASFVGTLVPDAFIITESFTILAMVIVGGMGTLIGPVWGAILLTVLPEVLRGFGDFRLVLYGVALTLAVLFMPGGMMQAAQYFRAQFAFLRSKLGAEGRNEIGSHLTGRGPKPGRAWYSPVSRARPKQELRRSARRPRHFACGISQGEVFAIIGPNGAGKSTLLNLMSGHYQPDSGAMSFDGADLVGLARAQARAARAGTHLPEDTAVQPSVRARQCSGGFPCPSRPSGVAVCRARRRVPPQPCELPRAGKSSAVVRRSRARERTSPRPRSPTASSACSSLHARSQPPLASLWLTNRPLG